MSRAGHISNELRANLTKLGAEILLLQEPCAKNNVPACLGTHVHIITANKEGQYPWAAIAVTNQEILATNLKHMSSDKIVVTEIIIKNISKMYVISGYLSPNIDNSEVLDLLGRALACLRSSYIIIGLDSNAYSTTWGSPIMNAEGEVI